MEKLILRGIMYGADKIPDSWFEAVPGGYYCPKDKNGRPIKSSSQSRQPDSHRPRPRPRRHSTDSYDPHHAVDRRHNHKDVRHTRNDRHTADLSSDLDDHSHRRRNPPPPRRRSHSSPRRDDLRTLNGHRERHLPTDRSTGPSTGSNRSGSSGSPYSPARKTPGFVPPIQPPPARNASMAMPGDDRDGQQRTSMADRYVPYAHIYGNNADSPIRTKREARPVY